MHEEYSRRLGQRREAAARHQQAFRTIGNWRLAIVIGGMALAWQNWWLLPVPVIVFFALLFWHERIARKAANETRAIEFYEQSLARLAGRWTGVGESGLKFRDPHHPYADDLDIFGEGSLFQLMNSARTQAGEETLARWLTAASPSTEVRLRHEAIRELAGKLDLREDLALLGENVRAGLHARALLAWGNAAGEPIRPLHRILAMVLTAGLLLTFTGYMLQLWPLWPVLLVILGLLVFYLSVRPAVSRILRAMELPGRDLGILAALIARVETEPFQSDLLRSLTRRIQTEGLPASRQIARLRRTIEFRDQARHQMFAMAAEPLLWSVHAAFAIERWRQTSGPHLGDWIAAMGEVEALSSLAGYASENREDVFPALLEEGPVFDGEGITHPLLPKTAVRNDVRLDAGLQLLLVSGSNMSGKSTLMRSVGLNAVLAWAGAPVRAHGLRISPVEVGASVRVQDSIQDGKSRFYAEITRLRQIADMAGGPVPLLFLLDELLSGTNSHDRLQGSEAVVRNLIRQGAIGLVTTHDLALAHIADELAPKAINVHFEDHIEGGRIAFDYQMRSGVVRKSNAIELMRSVGLDV